MLQHAIGPQNSHSMQGPERRLVQKDLDPDLLVIKMNGLCGPAAIATFETVRRAASSESMSITGEIELPHRRRGAPF